MKRWEIYNGWTLEPTGIEAGSYEACLREGVKAGLISIERGRGYRDIIMGKYRIK